MADFAVDAAAFRGWERKLAAWLRLVRDPEPMAADVAAYLLAANRAGIAAGTNAGNGGSMGFVRAYSAGTRRRALADGLTATTAGNQIRIGWTDPTLRQWARWLAAGHPRYFVAPRTRKALRFIPTGGSGYVFSRGHFIPAAPPRQLLGLRPGDDRAIRRLILGRFR